MDTTTRIATIATILLFITPYSAVTNADSEQDDGNACKRTTNAAYKSCKNRVKDDYWISIGNCENISNLEKSKDCKHEAGDEKHFAGNFCKQQRYARDEICSAVGGEAYDPDMNPNNFLDLSGIVANPNPYFPLIPGTVRRYQAGDEDIVVRVTNETKQILGITTVVIRDTVSIDGVLVEDTDDWYAQDINGNVWYMGELSRNYEDGELVDLDGSWKAGVDGAKAGIIMKAIPEVGDVYRQEFFLGKAEDMAEVISVTGSASVPAAECVNNCIVTRDFLPIEPNVNENKYYAPGIGAILVINLGSGERDELVEHIRP